MTRPWVAVEEVEEVFTHTLKVKKIPFAGTGDERSQGLEALKT